MDVLCSKHYYKPGERRHMKSFVTRMLAVAAMCCWPAVSWALSFGEIQAQSQLNERLDAEIALHALNPGEIVNAQVTLASAEAHARAGLQMQHILQKLRFSIVHRQDGRFVVKVTSKQPIREPVVEFVLELHWSGGRLQRAYALHLDPPSL
jgi:pilus assembly protein FimV